MSCCRSWQVYIISNPAVQSNTAKASTKGAASILPVTPIQAPIGDNERESPRTICEKLVNLLVYEYPKITISANGDMIKDSRFNIPAHTINNMVQDIVKNHKFVLPMMPWS